jgi:hypothetical protein
MLLTFPATSEQHRSLLALSSGQERSTLRQIATVLWGLSLGQKPGRVFRVTQIAPLPADFVIKHKQILFSIGGATSDPKAMVVRLLRQYLEQAQEQAFEEALREHQQAERDQQN